MELKARTVAPFSLKQSEVRIGPVPDTAPLALALGVALRLKTESISLVGFDGYSLASPAQQGLAAETSSMIADFIALHPEINLTSLTPGPYQVPSDSIYSRISLLSKGRKGRLEW